MKIKYMGSADVRRIEAGADFGGRLATPLAVDLTWDKDNHWVIDTDELNLPAEVVAVLAAEVGFDDVSGLELLPVNVHQSTYLGLTDAVAVAPVQPVEAELPAPNPVVVSEPDAPGRKPRGTEG